MILVNRTGTRIQFTTRDRWMDGGSYGRDTTMLFRLRFLERVCETSERESKNHDRRFWMENARETEQEKTTVEVTTFEYGVAGGGGRIGKGLFEG
jgi:hypothetical protein